MRKRVRQHIQESAVTVIYARARCVDAPSVYAPFPLDSEPTSIELPAAVVAVAPAPRLSPTLWTAFGISVVIALVLAAGYFRASAERKAAQTWVEHTLEVAQAIGRLQTVMLDAETGVRGFLLTRNSASLIPYLNAKQVSAGALNDLSRLVADNPAQQRRIAALDPLLQEKWQILDESIETMQAGKPNAALAEVGGGGASVMDAIRVLLGQMYAEESDLLSQRRALGESALVAEHLVIIVATAFLLASLFFLYRAMVQAISKRTNAEVALGRLNRTLEARVMERTARVTSLKRHLVRISEEERRKLGRELHDELGALLCTAMIDISTVTHQLRQAELSQFVSAAERALQSLRATAELSRRVMADLRPVLLEDFGLAKALEAYCADFESNTGIKCERVFQADLPKLELEMSIALFRITQECLSNIAKYAQATTVRVTLNWTGDTLRLDVEDDGIGVSNAALAQPNAYGILGMRERVFELCGDFHIGAGLNERGTGIHVALRPAAQPPVTAG